MAGADPILASVLQRRVQAISREMATALMRTSRSPIFNEIGDLVTVPRPHPRPDRIRVDHRQRRSAAGTTP